MSDPKKSTDPFDEVDPDDLDNREREWVDCQECDGTGDDDCGGFCPICRGKGEVLR